MANSKETIVSFSLKKDKQRLIYSAFVLKEMNAILAALNFIFLENTLAFIEFNSYKFGIAKYSIEEGIFTGNVWETESIAKSKSELSYHYTSIGLDGTANNETNNKITQSVLAILDDSRLTMILNNVIISKINVDNEIITYFAENGIKS